MQLRPFEIANDLDDAEHADDQGEEVDAVPYGRYAERVARQTAVDVGADEAEQKADEDHPDRLEHGPMGQDDRGDQPEYQQGEIVRRAEGLRQRGKRRPEGRNEHGADTTGKERSERRDAQGGAGAPLLRHRVAVQRGDDRRGLARDVHQDGCGRAAVLGAVIDAGEHDQRRQGVEPERNRQQHGDGRDRSDARQDSDQRAEQAADQREAEILERQRRAEARCEILQRIDLHPSAPTTPAAAATAHRRR
jgi:hypothetical protein